MLDGEIAEISSESRLLKVACATPVKMKLGGRFAYWKQNSEPEAERAAYWMEKLGVEARILSVFGKPYLWLPEYAQTIDAEATPPIALNTQFAAVLILR